jgi:predicted ATPase
MSPARQSSEIYFELNILNPSREFSIELLALVACQSGAELEGAVARVSEAGLVFRKGTPPQAVFLFKHALLCDAAYGNPPRGQRQQLDAGIVSTLLTRRDGTIRHFWSGQKGSRLLTLVETRVARPT